MTENPIYQTAFDQMVGSENSQMVKAMIPYLPLQAQKILSLYTKTQELSNVLRLFSSNQTMQICSDSVPDATAAEMINDIEKYCYGETRHQLNQLNNLFIILEMISVMNQS